MRKHGVLQGSRKKHLKGLRKKWAEWGRMRKHFKGRRQREA